MHLPRESGPPTHHTIAALPQMLRRGDLLVVNDTRVVPARLFGKRHTGGRVEILLLPDGDPHGRDTCPALVKAGGTVLEGEVLTLDGGGAVRVAERHGRGQFLLAPIDDDLGALCERWGRMPLPPYIRRQPDDERGPLDRERYQTVYARAPGAVAAPTAGLHLSQDLLAQLTNMGVERASVTLHVGLGTFQPIKTDSIDDHEMHAEWFTVPQETADAIVATRERGGRVVAVGTTSVRALESAVDEQDLPRVGSGTSRLFLRPGSPIRVVDALLTNFHLPRSTLLCLVSAFAGRERVLAAYRTAVDEGYRFYSYGDAMLIS
jgi:S-adenosylmethionine:tRNA ribosyltransferase-isomerase